MDANKITGTSLINHKMRVKLNLTIAEYAVMVYSENVEINKKLISSETVWSALGVSFELFIKIREMLVEKGFLEKGTKKILPKWKDAFGNTEEYFELFWAAIVIADSRYTWPGSKADAKKKFLVALKDKGFDYLMRQKKYYFTVIHESTFDRAVMGCPVFLSPVTKRYEEDWFSQTNEGKNALKKTMLKPSNNKSVDLNKLAE